MHGVHSCPFEALTQRLFPPPLTDIEFNARGHPVVTLEGEPLAEGDEERWLEDHEQCLVDDEAAECLGSATFSEARLRVDCSCRIVLVPIAAVPATARTPEGIVWYCETFLGYRRPIAGDAMYLRAHLDNRLIRYLGFWEVLVPHEPINGGMLSLDCRMHASWLITVECGVVVDPESDDWAAAMIDPNRLKDDSPLLLA